MSARAARHLLTDSALLLAAAVLVYLIDRISKSWIEANVSVGEQIDVIGSVVQIWHTENAGAAFGLLQGGGLLFVIVAVVTLVIVGWVHVTGRMPGPLGAILLGMVVGGTLGNLTDRLVDGTVTDFVSVGIGSLRWPTFNVADASVVVGILGLVLFLSVLDRRAAASAT